MKPYHGLFAAGALALVFSAAPASAMPAAPGDMVAPKSAAEQVRWVCNPWGQCWRQPGYGYGGYGYRRGWGGPGYGGYGYRRGWGGPGYGLYGHGGGWGYRHGYGGGWGHRGWGHRHW